MIEIFVNGSPHSISDSANVDSLIDALGVPANGVALAINGELIPKSGWSKRSLSPSDRVELLTIAQGG